MRYIPFVFCLVIGSGCAEDAGYEQLELIDVTGKITLDNAPLAGVRVVFESPDKSGAEGITDAEGEYRLMYDAQTAGCPAGPKTVRITTAALVEEGADPDNPVAGETVPLQYNRESKLTAEVTSRQKVFNFDLTSKP